MQVTKNQFDILRNILTRSKIFIFSVQKQNKKRWVAVTISVLVEVLKKKKV